MNKRGLGYLWWAMILAALTIGAAVQMNPDFDVNLFKNNLNWTHIEFELEEAPELGGALEAFVNGLGEAAYYLIKWAADIAKDYPNVPFQLLLYIAVIAVFAPIILLILKATLLLFVIIKEMIQSRREKRLLREERIKRQEVFIKKFQNDNYPRDSNRGRSERVEEDMEGKAETVGSGDEEV